MLNVNSKDPNKKPTLRDSGTLANHVNEFRNLGKRQPVNAGQILAQLEKFQKNKIEEDARIESQARGQSDRPIFVSVTSSPGCLAARVLFPQ